MPLTEEQRLAALGSYAVLDTSPEAEFDELTQLATKLCETPIALVSLIDRDRQWFKSCVGLDAHETPRALAFCAHAIESPDPLVVTDATKDPRFASHPLVVGAPGIRFYAGFPLVDGSGASLGTLCVIDTRPRELAATQLASMQALARQVVSQLHARRQLIRETFLRGEVERAHRHARFIAQAGKLLGASLDVNATLRTIASMSVPAIADACSIVTVDDDGTLRRLAEAALDRTAEEDVRSLRERPGLPDAQLPMREAIAARRTLLFSDYRAWLAERLPTEHPYRRVVEHLGVRSAIVAPMLVGDRVRGALSVAVLEKTGRTYDESNVTMMEELAQQAALALENARLYAEVIAANRMKDAFIAAVSHDLRTPLSAILGWTQLLEKRGADPEFRRHAIEVIERNARAQSRLIEDLLDVSRIDAKQPLEVAHDIVDLAAIVTATLDDLRPTADARQVTLTGTIDPSEISVRGDAGRLQQVVWNLASNAIKFSNPGGGVELRVARESDNAVLTVRDHGRGIPPDLLPHVFERFRQDDAGVGKRLGGLGLGLAIAKHIVEASGGTIAATSDGPGKGACFTVTLPLNAEVARPRG